VIAVAATGAPPVGITGIAAHLPARTLASAEIAASLGLTAEWIEERTGILERRIAEPWEAASDLAIPAARAALARAGADPAALDLVVVATATPDTPTPATAALVAHAVGAGRAAAYDVSAASTGFLYALGQAYAAIAAGAASRVLVVCSEVLSRITNWRDRDTCVLFGDGAAAAVVERVEHGGLLGFELGADGALASAVAVPAGGSRLPPSERTIGQDLHGIHMDGAKVFRFSARVTVESVRRLLDRCGSSLDDVDLYVPHQSNRRLIEHSARALGLPPERVLVNIDRRGNTSSASIPLALAEAAATGALRAGQTLLLSAVGAGMTWGCALLVWSGERVA
jgi:3-oxoacyl-[acyl-carrier-protein] synthase-3